MKKRKPANFDYDFTGLAVEVTGDDLYLINGGAEVENSHQGVANAQVGDTITRSNGQVVTLNQGDIDHAQKQLGISGPTTETASPTPTPTTTPTPNVTMGGTGGATVNNSIAQGVKLVSEFISQKTKLNQESIARTASFTDTEIDTIMKRNPGVYESREELLAELNYASDDKYDSDGKFLGIFKSVDAAALHWAKSYGDDSIVRGKEFCSAIFALDTLERMEDGSVGNQKTYYTYNKPLEGAYAKNSEGKLRGKRSWFNTNQEYYTTSKPSECIGFTWFENISIVSTIHSHGNYNGGSDCETPSDEDRKNLKKDNETYSGSYIGKNYLVTPQGFLIEFSENAEDDFTISDECIRDIRLDMSKELRKSSLGASLFDFAKNTFYNPTPFYEWKSYPVGGVYPTQNYVLIDEESDKITIL